MGKKGGNGAGNGGVIEKQVERLPSTEENETVSNKQLLIKLTNMEEKLGKIEDLVKSVDFAHAEIQDLKMENKSLRDEVGILKESMINLERVVSELKEGLVDVRSRSMRKNLVFTNLPEKKEEETNGKMEDSEDVVRKFMADKMMIENVDKIEIARAHRFGKSRSDRPRPLVVRFEKYKDKERVARHGKNLQGLNYGVNDQFPQEVMNRRKNLFPILRKARQNQIRAVIKVDKLYINKVLFDPEKNDIDQIIKNLKDKQ